MTTRNTFEPKGTAKPKRRLELIYIVSYHYEPGENKTGDGGLPYSLFAFSTREEADEFIRCKRELGWTGYFAVVTEGLFV